MRPDYTVDDSLIRATSADAVRRVRVYRPSETIVVLGRGSRPEAEVDLEVCLREGVPLLRRRGGGCAVVLDPGNVVVSVATPGAGFGNVTRHLDRLSGWLADSLSNIGFGGLERRGISDLVLDDRKVSGSCLYRSKDLVYFSATILVDPDIALVERYLKHPPREPKYRRGRSHRDFVGTLGGSAAVAAAALERLFEERGENVWTENDIDSTPIPWVTWRSPQARTGDRRPNGR